jgi:GNAT superfamily N-acetyltransferase
VAAITTRGPRVELRPAAQAEIALVATGRDAEMLCRVDGLTTLALIPSGGASPAGLLQYRVTQELLTIATVVVRPELRGRGLGSEAVRLVEDAAAQQHGSRRFEAWVSEKLGLGLYFWLRLGYRPPPSSPAGVPEGVISMVRSVDISASPLSP